MPTRRGGIKTRVGGVASTFVKPSKLSPSKQASPSWAKEIQNRNRRGGLRVRTFGWTPPGHPNRIDHCPQAPVYSRCIKCPEAPDPPARGFFFCSRVLV